MFRLTALNILIYSTLFSGAAKPDLLAADFGGGDVFAQGGQYTELGSGGGTWAIVGGGGGANLGRHLSLFVEGDYSRLSQSAGSISVHADLFVAGGGGRIYFPIASERVRLFVPAVGGFYRGRIGAILDYVSPQMISGAYAGGGFGAEIGVTKRFGLRPEFRYIREFWYPEFGQGTQNNALRATVGAYYRFGVK